VSWLQLFELIPALLQEQIMYVTGLTFCLLLAAMPATALNPAGNGKQDWLPLR
jgi:hypothetical protein